MKRILIPFVMATVWLLPATSFQGDPALADVVNATVFRNIGPFRTSAWITDIAVPEAPLRDHLYTIYAATRNAAPEQRRRFTVSSARPFARPSSSVRDSRAARNRCRRAFRRRHAPR
jgi:hypothetical protein